MINGIIINRLKKISYEEKKVEFIRNIEEITNNSSKIITKAPLTKFIS